MTCSSANNCDTDACINDNCENELRACIRDGRMFGMADCGTTWDCVLNCAPNDADCIGSCIDASSEDGYFGVQDVIACINENMCQDPAMCPACDAVVNTCRGE